MSISNFLHHEPTIPRTHDPRSTTHDSARFNLLTNRNGTKAFEQLLDHLKQARGFDVGTYRLSALATRIDKRLAAVGAGSYDEYIDHLEVHPDEFGHLFNAILIDVTTFFRDPETFDFLRA